MTPKKIEFKTGETVVYPKHGVGEIINIESMEIASIKTTFYVVKMEQSKLTIRVPLDKQEEVGLRKISSKKVIDNVFDVLKLKPKIKRIMWSRRAQEYDAKIFSGEPIKIAEVLIASIWVKICEMTSPFTMVVIRTFKEMSIDILIMVIFLDVGSLISNSQVPTKFFATS